MIPGHQGLITRLQALWALLALAGGALGLRLVQLQIIERGEYRLAAERNRSQIIYQTAPRGRLYDRRGVAIATNKPAFSLIYLPGKAEDRPDLEPLARDLARQLKQEPQAVLDKLQQAVREETAIRLAENLPPRTMFRLSELKTIYPGVDLIVEARRHYPFGNFASHLVGYMGKMDPRSWKELKPKGYRADSRIGKLGLEGVFERELRGRDGGLRMEVDAQGRLKRVLERVSWEAGTDIHLTLDAAIQRAADEGLKKSTTGRGAVVVLDPRNGAILALSSAPGFDPNAFLSEDLEEARRTATALPEFNKAIAGVYQPGSTFKIVVGAAGFQEGRVRPEESVNCPGSFTLGKKTFLCWEKKGHKRVSWLQGFAHSCDVYFYTMGLRIGGTLIEQYAKAFGLGVKTNIALKGEKAGNPFGPKARAAAGRPWYDGETVNLSIGQGELLTTPIQMAVLVAAVANRGTLWRPHYTERIVYSDGRPPYEQKPEKLGGVELRDDVWRLLDDAMSLVVSSGTGGWARIPGLSVRGKTGTAQNPLGEDHALFVAYAARPGEEPSLAISILVENGGHGGSVAAPIARQLLLAGFGLEERAGRVLPSTGTIGIPLPGPPDRIGGAVPLRTL